MGVDSLENFGILGLTIGEKKMEKNYDILEELNARGRKIWNVFDDSGKWVGAVGSTDNNRQTALRYAQRKYGRNVQLVFREWKN